MIDAVNSVLGQTKPEPVQEVKTPEEGGRVPFAPATPATLTEASVKIKTATGTKVYGSSYGNSAKAVKDQTRSSVDDIKEPTKKDIEKDSNLYQKGYHGTSKHYLRKDTQNYMSKVGEDVEVVEAAKPDFLDMDKDGNKKESMKKAIADKGMKEELKGNQYKIDANHNDKIDAQDFKILKGKKKVKEGMDFANKLLETVRKSDVPAYLRKAKGDTPLTVADVKGPKKDSISAPQNLAKNRNEWKEDVDFTEEQLDEMLNEVLGKDASAGDWIHDFVHSDNPKFAGKSKAERKKMALGAYYGKQNEATNYEPSDAPLTTDTLAGRMPGGKSNSFKSFKIRVRPLSKEGETKPGDDTPKVIQPQDTPARRSHEVKEEAIEEVTIAGTPGWKEMKKDVKDKSGAVHTPMSRAKDLARSAFKKIQKEVK
jgi:hypothetical protein